MMDSTANLTHNSSGLQGANSMSIYLHESMAVKVFRLTVEVLIALGGVFGNILVCLVITRHFRVKTPINFYILNLAIADLGMLFVNFPFAVLREQSPSHWPLGEGVCLYLYPLTEVFYGASVWSIAAIAIERYRTIVSVSGVSARQSAMYKDSVPKFVYVTVAAIWIISFLVVSLPTFFMIKYNKKFSICYIQPTSFALEQAYSISLSIFWYLLPLGIISWTYFHIERSLRQSTTFHNRMSKNIEMSSIYNQNYSSKQYKMERVRQNSKVRRILTPVLIMFAVTMLPVNIFRLVLTYWKEILYRNYFFIIYNVCIVLVVINSASNAFIYSLVSNEFRNGFKTLLMRK